MEQTGHQQADCYRVVGQQQQKSDRQQFIHHLNFVLQRFMSKTNASNFISCRRGQDHHLVRRTVGKPPATGQPTRPTQPFILPGSINE